MNVYFEHGIAKDIAHPLEESERSEFYIQETENDTGEKYIYPGDSIKYELDAALVALYDKLRDLFFYDTDKYYCEIKLLPAFAQSAGQDSDCGVTAESFQKWIRPEAFGQLPNFYRHLYLVDCQFLIGSIQNLLSGMEYAFTEYYIQLSYAGNGLQPISPDGIMIEMSQRASQLSSLLEVYFIKAYSILDMLCKIGYEIQNPETEFDCYKKIKSADLLWGARKKLQINHVADTLFEACDLVSVIEALRNEVVHNGTWELRPKVFIKFEGGCIVERFMLFPDISQGHLATVKNRKHFFGNGDKVNCLFPEIHMAFQKRLLNTIQLLNSFGM